MTNPNWNTWSHTDILGPPFSAIKIDSKTETYETLKKRKKNEKLKIRHGKFTKLWTLSCVKINELWKINESSEQSYAREKRLVPYRSNNAYPNGN